MNPAKFISWLRGDPIEQWLEDLDQRIKSNPISRGIRDLVFYLMIIAIIFWVLRVLLGI